MAEARSDDVTTTMPQAGKVQEVCRKWLVHEDGALAHELQNNEIDFHYGLNRKNRRTVREDIPVAKLVQSEEEARLQRERMMELQALQAQAEEDAKVAHQIQNEVATEDVARQMADEEIARLLQEKEKKKYERYLEKKKERQLQKQREKLEKELAQHSEDARLVMSGETGTVAQVTSSVDSLSLEPGAAQNGLTRVTPAGHIEDDGDFSDFYTVPPDANEHQKKAIQEVQDGELAKLLQEQEHKRSKAEVDRDKLRQIEAQDEQLARVIQEQEKLKLRKAKQKRQQLREQQRLHQEAGLKPSQTLDNDRALIPSPDPPAGVPDGHLYRRNSYTRSISNSTRPVQAEPPPRQSSVSRQQSEPVQAAPPALPARDPPSYQDYKQRQMIQASRREHASNGGLPTNEVNNVERWLAESPSPPLHSLSATSSPSHGHVPPPYGRAVLDQNRRGRGGVSEEGMPPSPSPPGSYHSNENLSGSFSPEVSSRSSHSASNPGFNIAAAIDPTYRRRQHEIEQTDQTEVKHQIPFSRSLPSADDTELEWDPGVRGSLRRPHGHWNPSAGNYQEIVPDNMGTSSSHDSDSLADGQPVLNQWQPVQGQKRSTLDKSRKTKKPLVVKKDSKGSCKQQ
ncbi:genetic suppressor element 1-like isoform X2 [Gigantopelta aegis]|uniref:genetic suppressor element 1-like isoform X2 n=1 Tax=Gigantopelta aegis TaxID=1735272 RepID=UPI001B88A227|nr:genetic suppressor element 1-like isoform X2 [Gigantopelta aegis]